MPQSKQFVEAVERTQATTIIRAEDENRAERPDYENSLYRRQIEDVNFVRTVYGGTKTLRDAGEEYLPRHGEEDEDTYKTRKKQTVAFNAFAKTVDSLTGMVFRKDPAVDVDLVPDNIVDDLDNVDLSGRDLPTFARHVFTDALIDGHSYILVDFPKMDRSQVRSLADERATGARPYWVNLKKHDVINLRWEMRGGRPVLTLVVYREQHTEPLGTFGERVSTRYRVLRPGEFEVWERQQNRGKVQFELVDSGQTSLNEISLVPVYANRTGIFESRPPLLDLAYENVDHYQIRSDHGYGRLFAMVPMPFIAGIDADAFRWGPGQAITTEAPDAKAQILESSGAALSESRQDMKEVEARMAALGLQMLTEQRALTATERILDKSEGDASLAAAARNLQNALNTALQLHSEYRSVEVAENVIAVSRDFEAHMIDPQMVQVLSDLVQKGQLRLETMWDIMRQGEVLPDDFDPDVEREEVQAIGPLNDLLALTAGGQRGTEPPLPEEAA